MNVQKDAAIRPALNKLILDYYKKEDIFASKERLHENLNTSGNRLVRRQGLNGAKKNLDDIWVLFDHMPQQMSNLTFVTENSNFPPLNIRDINAVSFYGDLTQMKQIRRK